MNETNDQTNTDQAPGTDAAATTATASDNTVLGYDGHEPASIAHTAPAATDQVAPTTATPAAADQVAPTTATPAAADPAAAAAFAAEFPPGEPQQNVSNLDAIAKAQIAEGEAPKPRPFVAFADC